MALTQVEVSGVSQTGNNNVFAQVGPFKNRIINGDMRIDQRNAGASISTTGGFPVDRWIEYFSGGGVFSAQRSTTAPAGFNNSLLLTVTTADSSIAALDYYMIRHNVEGFNTADLGFGAAGASFVTLSFWVRSSVTGTYGGTLTNNAENRCYPFSYAINSANTFEYKTITIAGDTTGTWLTDNSRGFGINFGLGMGSSLSGTAGAWSSSTSLCSATGATNWIATSGATFYITGVQLEAGTVATPFERRSYGQELALCQRYFSMSYPQGTAPGTATSSGLVGAAAQFAGGAGGSLASVSYPVQMRGTPTISLWDAAGTSNKASYTGSGNYTLANNGSFATTGATYISSTSFLLSPTTAAANSQAYAQYTASAEL